MMKFVVVIVTILTLLLSVANAQQCGSQAGGALCANRYKINGRQDKANSIKILSAYVEVCGIVANIFLDVLA
ncbi:hypothetical protein H5410_035674 [Solanum commersonii]|uniref:Uncharacterized protein n=1 Tax=Solanum commersonii TaxID=4109 RepID=A0A9J5Y3A8_SOLCO|nr:hypothetical protein H5410_035674 [Solanum commersonii]